MLLALSKVDSRCHSPQSIDLIWFDLIKGKWLKCACDTTSHNLPHYPCTSPPQVCRYSERLSVIAHLKPVNSLPSDGWVLDCTCSTWLSSYFLTLRPYVSFLSVHCKYSNSRVSSHVGGSSLATWIILGKMIQLMEHRILGTLVGLSINSDFLMRLTFSKIWRMTTGWTDGLQTTRRMKKVLLLPEFIIQRQSKMISFRNLQLIMVQMRSPVADHKIPMM